MNHVGVSSGFHDAALSIIDDRGNIVFASHSERYSKRKHDAELHEGLIKDAEAHMGKQYQLTTMNALGSNGLDACARDKHCPPCVC